MSKILDTVVFIELSGEDLFDFFFEIGEGRITRISLQALVDGIQCYLIILINIFISGPIEVIIGILCLQF